MAPIAIIVKFVLKSPADIESFISYWCKVHNHTHANEPDATHYELHRSANDPRTFFIIERYLNEEAVDAHLNSEEFKTFRADLEGLSFVESFNIERMSAISHPAIEWTRYLENQPKSVLVFAGARLSKKNAGHHVAAATSLAHSLLKRGRSIVYGGGTVGLMGIFAKAVIEKNNKANIISVIPGPMCTVEVVGKMLGTVYFTPSFSERKRLMFSLSDTVVILPGGAGTFDETLEVITNITTNVYRPKLGFLNSGNFFGPFFSLLKHMVEEGYVDSHIFDYFVVENSDYAETLLNKLESFTVPTSILPVTWSSDKCF